jgi:hypothetical protein
MPEWYGAGLKLLGSFGTAFFGILALGRKTRDASDNLTGRGYVALVGIVVSALLASASTLYEYRSSNSKDELTRARNEEARINTLRTNYPMKGISAVVEVSFTKDFPALTQYKAKLRASLPAHTASCQNSKLFQCIDSDDSGITYGIPATSALYPKRGEFIRKALDNVAIGVSFIKPQKSHEDEHFTRLGSFYFKPAEFSEQQAIIQFNPGTGALSYLFEKIQIPDAIPISSNIYSLGEAFPGFVYANVGVAKFPTMCSEESDSAQKKCQEELPLDGLNSVRLDNLGFRFPYSKSFGVDQNSVKCSTPEEGELLVLALPDSIDQIDSYGRITPPIDQQEKTKGLCDTIKKPDF